MNKTRKKRAISASFTISSFMKNVDRLTEINYLEKEEIEQLKELERKLINKMMSR